jgi:hypothetical protein
MSAPRRTIPGRFCPLGLDDKLTISRLMTEYNPDSVPDDKVVHVDAVAGKSLTYGGLRRQAGRCAWGLKNVLGVQEGDVVLVVAPNSVCIHSHQINQNETDHSSETDYVTLFHSIVWAGAVFSYALFFHLTEIDLTANPEPSIRPRSSKTLSTPCPSSDRGASPWTPARWTR